MLTAFVDESARSTGTGQCYVVAAAVTIGDEERVRDAMVKLKTPKAKVLHWHDEGPARRREIVRRLNELEVQAFAVGCHPIAARRQERARALLLNALAGDLALEGVDAMVIEARQAALNTRDRSTLLSAQKAGVAPAMSYSHVGKLAEPLLWVADIIAGVVSAHLAGSDSTYFAQLETSLLRVRTINPAL